MQIFDRTGKQCRKNAPSEKNLTIRGSILPVHAARKIAYSVMVGERLLKIALKSHRPKGTRFNQLPIGCWLLVGETGSTGL